MTKGEYPSNLDSQGRERRKWNAFWDVFPGWLRQTIVVAGTAFASYYATVQAKPATPSALMDEDDWRRVVREELKRGIAPLAAGFKESIKDRPASRQVAILEAMNAVRENQKDTK